MAKSCTFSANGWSMLTMCQRTKSCIMPSQEHLDAQATTPNQTSLESKLHLVPTITCPASVEWSLIHTQQACIEGYVLPFYCKLHSFSGEHKLNPRLPHAVQALRLKRAMLRALLLVVCGCCAAILLVTPRQHRPGGARLCLVMQPLPCKRSDSATLE
eukprot:2949511-Amphidinium_carterae.1